MLYLYLCLYLDIAGQISITSRTRPEQGKAIAGLDHLARLHQHPLQCSFLALGRHVYIDFQLHRLKNGHRLACRHLLPGFN